MCISAVQAAGLCPHSPRKVLDSEGPQQPTSRHPSVNRLRENWDWMVLGLHVGLTPRNECQCITWSLWALFHPQNGTRTLCYDKHNPRLLGASGDVKEGHSPDRAQEYCHR